MVHIEILRDAIPEPAKDIRLNLQSVFTTTTLTPNQLWGTAIAAAIASRNKKLVEAILQDASGVVDVAVTEDAKAAASLMAMNNVYYRFRHLVGKEGYGEKAARLRMNWIAKPRGSKIDFELYCLVVSAINGCETCIRSHERVVVEGGLSEDQVHDAIRVAATLQATAIALEIGNVA
jgi:alkyl hydroperoxide reductase subunit D